MSISVHNLGKAFFGVEVLKGIDITIEPGEILGLVGENGAGKSTLMNILGGHLQPDVGTIHLDGQAFGPRSSRDALAAGIGMVHQELNLFPNLTVADNLYLSNYHQTAGVIAARRVKRDAQQALERVGLDVSPTTRLSSLYAGQQQLVEIAKSLTVGARYLLIDEPTTSLSDRECQVFFRLIHELADSGQGIMLITHAIDDVLQHCNRVAVLRDGELIGVHNTTDTDSGQLVAQMVGRSVELFAANRAAQRTATPLLQVENLSQPQTVKDVSLTVHQGEVLGMFGLMGSGRSELARMLMGIDRYRSGQVRLAACLLKGGPRKRIAQGLGLVTESRREDGIFAESSIAENLAIVAIEEFSGLAGKIDSKRLQQSLQDEREQVMLQQRVRNEQPLKTLSGGNQQKVVIGKWLLKNPKVLVLDEPTRGIDVGAKQEVYQLVNRLADSGSGVLVISSELEELVAICDRIIVMSLGRISGNFAKEQFDSEAIMNAALAFHGQGGSAGSKALVNAQSPEAARTPSHEQGGQP